MTLSTKQRISWLDIAKAIAIFLVILGHTLRGGVVQQMVYSFHVATFFMLSGMTCKTDRLKSRIKNDFLRTMIPYYFFGIVSILFFSVLGQFAANQLDMDVNTSFLKNLFNLLYACPIDGRLKFNMPLWFLPCLFATKLLYYALFKLCKGNQTYILLSSVSLAAVGFVYTRLGGPGLPFNLSVAVKMLAFFSIGRFFFLCLPAVREKFLTRNRSLFIGLALLAIACLTSLAAPKVSYASDIIHNIPVYIVTTITGSFGVCFLSMWIDSCKVLEYTGKNTLAILTMHKFPLLVFQTIGPQKNLLAQNNSFIGIILAVSFSLIAAVMCLAVGWVINRYFPYIFGDFSRLQKKKDDR